MAGNYGTHREVLKAVLKVVNKPVLELGAGDYSTPLIHNLLKDRRIPIVTIDHDRVWLSKYEEFKTKYHSFLKISRNEDLMKYFEEDKTDWGLVFIDNGSWRMRYEAVRRYSQTADYIVLHDCDYFPDNGLFGKTLRKDTDKRHGARWYGDMFVNWIELVIRYWVPGSPPTLLGSNKHKLDELIFENMLVCNKSK